MEVILITCLNQFILELYQICKDFLENVRVGLLLKS